MNASGIWGKGKATFPKAVIGCESWECKYNDDVELGCRRAWEGKEEGRGKGGGRHRGDVRNNTTTKGKCTSPKVRPRDQDWSQFEADSPGFAADLAVRAVAAF